VIIQQDRRLARFVDELLDATEIRAGRTSLKLSVVNLGEIIRDVVGKLGLELASSGSAISVSVDNGVLGFWDEMKLSQIVSNLLSNAIKFGLSKPIEIRASMEDDVATFVIRDHGIGIAEERLDAIFDPFERAVSARHYGGLGLGLYVVRELVTAMAGTVQVSSRIDEGSTFTVVLPRSRTT
jgi:signal transduction histidine kinase